MKRKPNILSTSVYRKPIRTFSSLGLSFFIYTPFIYKINSIKTLISRAYIIYSNYSLYHAKLQFLRTYFCNNGYPLFLFDNCVKKCSFNLFEPNVTTSNYSNYFYFINFHISAPSLTTQN